MNFPFTLTEILESAHDHPMYPHFRGIPCNSPDLTTLPTLEKGQLYQSIQDLYQKKHPLVTQSIYISPTGGTSGTSLYFPTDVKENRRQRQFIGELASLTGAIDSNDVILVLHGGRPMYRSQDLVAEVIDNANATSLYVGTEASDDQVYDIAMRFFANGITATPTRLLQFATWIQQNNKEIHLDKILFTSEPLPPRQERFLRQQFNANVVTSLYGSAEGGVWAASLPSHEITSSRCFIYDSSHMLVEICDSTGQPLPMGHSGEIVLTSFMKKRNPLIRYKTGDVGRISPLNQQEIDFLTKRNQTIPSTLSKLELEGRDSSKSFHFHGDYVDSNILEETFSKFPSSIDSTLEVLSWQVIVSYGKVEDECEYRLVLNKPIPPNSLFLEKIHEKLCKNMELDGDEHAEALVKVSIIQQEELKKGSMAGKTLKIIDLRK